MKNSIAHRVSVIYKHFMKQLTFFLSVLGLAFVSAGMWVVGSTPNLPGKIQKSLKPASLLAKPNDNGFSGFGRV